MVRREAYIRIWEDLAREKSMVFLAGPRQSGKTTLAQQIAEGFSNRVYASWDIPDHRARILRDPSFFTTLARRDSSKPLVVFDEIHKHHDWKNYLKGVFDEHHEAYRFLVTGSGRLDLYERGGDSLAGRYLPFRLWPFTVAELAGGARDLEAFLEVPLALPEGPAAEAQEVWEGLRERSGFPEPFLAGRERSWRLWSATYSRQLVREDIRDLTGIRAVEQLESLYTILPTKVGSPLSATSLAEDLKVAYNTVRNWIEAFERFFLVFTVPPWTKRINRAILKERKLYLWDAPRIPDPAARHENLVALELRRAVANWTDAGHSRFSLHFVKDRQGREVDFLVAEENRPLLLVEAKRTAEEPSPALRRFQAALGIPAVQLTESGSTYREFRNGDHRILVAPAHRWLAGLPC